MSHVRAPVTSASGIIDSSGSPRRRFWRRAVATLLVVPVLLQMAAAADSVDSGGGPIRKKLIQTGWDRPTPSVLLRNLEAREALPFVGMGVKIIGTDDEGGPVRMRDAGNARPWKRAWFQAQVDTLRQIRSTKLTDNFVYVDLSPAKAEFVDAFDDAGWEVVVDHLRIAAWLAREGGLKGIMFDPEAYRGSIVKYRNRLHTDRSFDEYAAKVRQRGREIMRAMASEYPDMTFFTLFMHSGIAMGAFGLDPREGLEHASYSLYPAFINGWLDAIPPTMCIIDGFEMAYPHSSELQYLKHVNAMRNASLALVDPANHTKYRAQVRAGLAIYLDAFTKYPMADVHADVWTDPPLTGTINERLTAAVMSALEVVDEYVWVYSETYRWLPGSQHSRGAVRTWEEALPGVTEALRRASVAEERALARAEKEFRIRERKEALRGIPMRSLVVNGDFNNGAPGTARPAVDRPRGKPIVVREAAEGWRTWNGPGSAGLFTRGYSGHGGFGSAQISAAAEGGFVQDVEASPYRFYKVRGWVRSMGVGEASIRLSWLDAEGEPMVKVATPVLVPEGSPHEAWRRISGVVRCPAEGQSLRVRLTVSGQTSDAHVVWFDDVEVFHIDVN